MTPEETAREAAIKDLTHQERRKFFRSLMRVSGMTLEIHEEDGGVIGHWDRQQCVEISRWPALEVTLDTNARHVMAYMTIGEYEFWQDLTGRALSNGMMCFVVALP